MFERLTGTAPVLYFSGGKESTLLLSMLREQPVEFGIVTQGREWWTKEQREHLDNLIIDWKLKVFSYPPVSSHLQGNSLVSYYAMGDSVMPIVRDFVGEGERCLADLDKHRMNSTPFGWDIYIFGSRKDDSHPLMDNLMPVSEWKIGNTTFWNPLYEWTREQVEQELDKRGLNFEVTERTDTGNLVDFCRRCVLGKGEVFCPAEQRMIPVI